MFALIPLVMLPITLPQSGLGLKEWYNEIFMCGVKKIGYSMTVLGRPDPKTRQWWESSFVFYWGFCIKYLIPTVLWFILCKFFKNLWGKPYGGYSTRW